MPIIDLEHEASFESIEVKVKGKTFKVVDNLSVPFFDRVTACKDPVKQLALVFNVDPKEFRDCDIRLLGKIVKATMNAIQTQVEGAAGVNPTKAGKSK